MGKIKKKLLMALSMGGLLVLMFVLIAGGFTSPQLIIAGKTKNVDPPPQIVDNRTMVPIRFVVEDETIKGEVFWDHTSQKVAMNCKGKYIELFVGNKKAAIDGQNCYLDTAPYIYEGRTYVPIRFIAEAIGAKVGWNPGTQEVSIDFNTSPTSSKKVFAYYYYKSFDELKTNAHLFTNIAFRWFQTDGQGNLFYEYQDDYEQILKFTRAQGIKTHASVVLMDKVALHQLLSNPSNRAKLIGNLLTKVKEDNYDGIDIDFEMIDPADAKYFTLFLQELKTALGPDKQLSVAVFARTATDHWPTPYEYSQIGKIADLVVVMAYDYSYTTSAPGPIAPLWWVENVVAYMTANIAKDKILLGLPTYGYDWAAGKKATTVTAARLSLLQQQYKLEHSFDSKSFSPAYTYWDKNGQYHQIWMENQASLSAKYDLATKNQLGGISFWRIGNGFNDLYNIIGKKQ